MQFRRVLLLYLVSCTLAAAQQFVYSKGLVSSVKDDMMSYAPMDEEIFADPRHHVLAVTSILKRASAMVNYSPHRQTPPDLVHYLEAFEHKVASFRGLIPIRTIQETLQLRHDLDNLQRAIEKKYASYDGSLIVKTLQDLAREAKYAAKPENRGLYCIDTSLQDTVLSVVTINKRRVWKNRVVVKLVKLRVLLCRPGCGKNIVSPVHAPPQDAEFSVQEFEVDAQYLMDNAQLLSFILKETTVDHFQRHFSTSEYGKLVDLSLSSQILFE